jgi:hypothetical protein
MYLQTFRDSQGQPFFQELDSQYNANPNEFRKKVNEKEKLELARFHDFQRIKDKPEEVKHL